LPKLSALQKRRKYLVRTNIFPNFSKQKASQIMKKKWSITRIIVLCVSVAIALSVLSVGLFAGGVDAKLSKEIRNDQDMWSVEIYAWYLARQSAPIFTVSNIQNPQFHIVVLLENFDRGSRDDGFANLSIISGQHEGGDIQLLFSDHDIQKHAFHGRRNASLAIAIITPVLQTITVFNVGNDNQTRSFYNQIVALRTNLES